MYNKYIMKNQYKAISMKKITLFIIILFFSLSLFARDFNVISSKKYKNQIEVFFTQPQINRGSQYTVIVARKNDQKYEALYVMSFHSQSDNDYMGLLAKDCYENVQDFIKTHTFQKSRFYNNALRFQDNKRIWFDTSIPLGYTDFRK